MAYIKSQAGCTYWFFIVCSWVNTVNKVYFCWGTGEGGRGYQRSHLAIVSHFSFIDKVRMTEGRECCLPEFGLIFYILKTMLLVNFYYSYIYEFRRSFWWHILTYFFSSYSYERRFLGKKKKKEGVVFHLVSNIY